jgi:hypothetical protein
LIHSVPANPRPEAIVPPAKRPRTDNAVHIIQDQGNEAGPSSLRDVGETIQINQQSNPLLGANYLLSASEADHGIGNATVSLRAYFYERMAAKIEQMPPGHQCSKAIDTLADKLGTLSQNEILARFDGLAYKIAQQSHGLERQSATANLTFALGKLPANQILARYDRLAPQIEQMAEGSAYKEAVANLTYALAKLPANEILTRYDHLAHQVQQMPECLEHSKAIENLAVALAKVPGSGTPARYDHLEWLIHQIPLGCDRNHSNRAIEHQAVALSKLPPNAIATRYDRLASRIASMRPGLEQDCALAMQGRVLCNMIPQQIPARYERLSAQIQLMPQQHERNNANAFLSFALRKMPPNTITVAHYDRLAAQTEHMPQARELSWLIANLAAVIPKLPPHEIIARSYRLANGIKQIPPQLRLNAAMSNETALLNALTQPQNVSRINPLQLTNPLPEVTEETAPQKFTRAQRHVLQGEYDEAIALYTALGTPEAKRELGVMHFLGYGSTANPRHGMDLLLGENFAPSRITAASAFTLGHRGTIFHASEQNFLNVVSDNSTMNAKARTTLLHDLLKNIIAHKATMSRSGLITTLTLAKKLAQGDAEKLAFFSEFTDAAEHMDGATPQAEQ